jgi:hypothetical protein
VTGRAMCSTEDILNAVLTCMSTRPDRSSMRPRRSIATITSLTEKKLEVVTPGWRRVTLLALRKPGPEGLALTKK